MTTAIFDSTNWDKWRTQNYISLNLSGLYIPVYKQTDTYIIQTMSTLEINKQYVIQTEQPGFSPDDEDEKILQNEFRSDSGYSYVGTFIEFGYWEYKPELERMIHDYEPSNMSAPPQSMNRLRSPNHIIYVPLLSRDKVRRFCNVAYSHKKSPCLSFVVVVRNRPITMWIDVSIKNTIMRTYSPDADQPSNTIYESNIWKEPYDQHSYDRSLSNELTLYYSKKIQAHIVPAILKFQVGKNYLIKTTRPGWDDVNHTDIKSDQFKQSNGYRYVGAFTGFGFHEPDYWNPNPNAHSIYVPLSTDDVQADRAFLGNYKMTFNVIVDEKPIQIWIDISDSNKVAIYPVEAESITEQALATLGPKLQNPYIIANFVKPFLNTSVR